MAKMTNPTMLRLLKIGARIELPDGRWFMGDTKYGWIDIGHADFRFGCYSLNKEGLVLALQDRDLLQAVRQQQ